MNTITITVGENPEFSHPIDPVNGIFLCSPENPMPKGAPGRWSHTNVEYVGDQKDGYPGGDWQHYRCKDCHHEWDAELPQ